MRILPSLLCARPDALADEVEAACGADGWHVDVMDGHQVPFLGCHPALVGALKKRGCTGIEAHLMVQNPGVILPHVREADSVTLHPEGQEQEHLRTLLGGIRQQGQRAGLALNPETPLEILDTFWPLLDHVLLMTVHPGRGGQPFMEEQCTRIRALRESIVARGRGGSIRLAVDGGINDQTARKAAQAGADALVVGSYLFGHDPACYAGVIRALKQVA
jgi:ribulose-phosphate 3-epimerase